MGNSVSFFKGHGKRLVNRYNAQYKALKFIDKGNLPKAPHHDAPHASKMPTLSPDKASELLRKDIKLDGFLKSVYVTSNSEVEQAESSRPLPEKRYSDANVIFTEPNEIDAGYCTLTQLSAFLAAHEENPEANNAAAIAKQYKLDEKKAESILKYHSVYVVFDAVKDGLTTKSWQFIDLPDPYEKRVAVATGEEKIKLIRQGEHVKQEDDDKEEKKREEQSVK